MKIAKVILNPFESGIVWSLGEHFPGEYISGEIANIQYLGDDGTIGIFVKESDGVTRKAMEIPPHTVHTVFFKVD